MEAHFYKGPAGGANLQSLEVVPFIRRCWMLGQDDWKDRIRSEPCSYCGRDAHPQKDNGRGKAFRTIDHIQPRSTGGINCWENYTSCCQACNQKRGTTPLLQFMTDIKVLQFPSLFYFWNERHIKRSRNRGKKKPRKITVLKHPGLVPLDQLSWSQNVTRPELHL
jgi:hypothetical protein